MDGVRFAAADFQIIDIRSALGDRPSLTWKPNSAGGYDTCWLGLLEQQVNPVGAPTVANFALAADETGLDLGGTSATAHAQLGYYEEWGNSSGFTVAPTAQLPGGFSYGVTVQSDPWGPYSVAYSDFATCASSAVACTLGPATVQTGEGDAHATVSVYVGSTLIMQSRESVFVPAHGGC